MRQPFHYDLPEGRSLHGTIDLPEAHGPRPTVIVCHGFKGFQEWGFFPAVAQLLAERGFTVIRFNLTSSGMKPGDELVTDLDAFRTATISQDVHELMAIVGAAGYRIAAGRVDRDRLALFGHSRGGGTALLTAAHAELADQIRALVTWSAVATYDRASDEEKAAWRREGSLIIVNARTGQELPVGIELLDDLEAHGDELQPLVAAGRRTAPWLVVHGEVDETVPVEEGRRLAEAARAPARLEVVAGADHTFGARHPFAGPTPHLIEALNATQRWLRRHVCD